MPVDDRIWRRWLEKVEVTDDHWWWRPTPSRSGYGQFWYMGEYVGAHVMACHLFFGTPIHRPREQTIDHLCREPLCVRPSHLNPTTQSVNILMALDRHRNAIKTECPKGHAYTVENTIVHYGPTGREWRKCRICHNERQREYQRRRVK